MAYAGLPQLAKEAKDKIARALEDINIGLTKGRVDADTVYKIADEVLTGMGRHYADLNLQMLIAVSSLSDIFTPLQMFVFDSKGLYPADTLQLLGLGDSSLLRYLYDTAYPPKMDTRLGARLAIYMVENAKKYIDHCGGKTDLIIIKEGRKWYSADDFAIEAISEAASRSQGEALRKMIENLHLPHGYPDPFQKLP
ncbi:MAG: hypothetical protein ABSD45_12850 [Terriglobia bacterium]|jgi:hypothetical protein